MGAKKSRLFAILTAAVLVFTSAFGVFAADSATSPSKGVTPAPAPTAQEYKTTVHTNNGTIDVPAGSTVTANGKQVPVNGTVASGIPKGALVVITSADGSFTDYRWMKSTKITKAQKKKLTWKKVKGASYYRVKITRKGKTYYRTVKGTKVSAKKLKLKTLKGAKFRVIPVKVVKGTAYIGGQSKAKKGKK